MTAENVAAASAVPDVPSEITRWRCARCGNLTRFDVLRTRKAHEYWHFDLAGAPEVTEDSVLTDRIERVVCRWCGADDSVELIARPEQP